MDTNGRLVGIAVATLATAATGVLWFLVLSPIPELAPDRAAAARAREINEQARERAGRPEGRWAVATSMSAMREMTVEVDAERLEDAPAIAWQIVEREIERYGEILIYVRQPGDPAHTVRRIQWTPLGGYTELTFTSQ